MCPGTAPPTTGYVYLAQEPWRQGWARLRLLVQAEDWAAVDAAGRRFAGEMSRIADLLPALHELVDIQEKLPKAPDESNAFDVIRAKILATIT